MLLLTFDAVVGHGDSHRQSLASPSDREIPIAAKYPHAEAFFFTAQSQQQEYQCEGKIYCSQMTSCEEAKFYLKNCPGVKIDGDGDGIPCESQWCRS
ncbi:MAG: excalibur calcium-binding domain-containing protein [Geitlerinemataceae cyanobacterium]